MQHRTLALLCAIMGMSIGWEIKLAPPVSTLASKKTGDNIMVTCLVDTVGGGISDATWTKDAKSIPMLGRMRAIGPYLYIIDATQADAGTYTCSMFYDGETKTKDVNINFFKAVQFTDAPESQHPVVGTDAQVVCRVDGDPRPQITWRMGNEELTSDSPRAYEFREGGQVLVITDYDSPADDGTYTCEATQPDSGTFETRTITVTGYVRPDITHPPNATSTALEGEDHTFTCAGVGTPTPTYLWYRGSSITNDSRPLDLSDKYKVDGGRLVISQVYPGDEGVYTCRAQNAIGRADAQAQLTVFKKPAIDPINHVEAAEGETIHIDCVFNGDGEIRAYWMFKGRSLDGMNDVVEEPPRTTATRTDNTLTLTIHDVTVTDRDTYNCETSNAAGVDSRSVRLDIKHAPVLIAFTTDTLRSFNNNRVRLMCSCDAVPVPSWRWYSPDGSEIVLDGIKYVDRAAVDDARRSELQVLTNKPTDYGTYRCIADNGVASADGSRAEAAITVVEVITPVYPARVMFNGSHPTYAIATVGAYDDATMAEASKPITVRWQYVDELTFDEAEEASGHFDWTQTAIVTDLPMVYMPSNKYILRRMLPQRDYRVRVRGENEAGVSEWSMAEPYSTGMARAPDTPTFVTADSSMIETKTSAGEVVWMCDDMCTIEWTEPDNHGKPVSGYVVWYADYSVTDSTTSAGRVMGDWTRVPVDGTLFPAHVHSAQVRMLAPDHYYVLRLEAVNELGHSMPAQMIIRTPDTLKTLPTGLSAGVVVLIIIVVLLIIFLGIDLLCYVLRECGLLWCLSSSVFGAHRGSHKVPGGGADSLRTLETASSTNERTPMMTTNGENATSGKATTV